MAKITIITDDFNGARDAISRRLILDDGTGKADVLEIDLVDGTFSQMKEKLYAALSAYFTAGVVTREKVAAPFSVPEAPEPFRTELPPQGITARKLAAPKAAPKAASAEPSKAASAEPSKATKAVAKRTTRASARASVQDTRPIEERLARPWYNAKNRPLNDREMERLKRPGINVWYELHWQLLGLPQPDVSTPHGRVTNEIEAAWDRYQGRWVTEDTLHEIDLARLTDPAPEAADPAPEAANGKPTPLAMAALKKG